MSRLYKKVYCKVTRGLTFIPCYTKLYIRHFKTHYIIVKSQRIIFLLFMVGNYLEIKIIITRSVYGRIDYI